MLVFPPESNSSCIDFIVKDDITALEDPEEFIWTLEPPAIPQVELPVNTTRVVITDDDRELPDIALIISNNVCIKINVIVSFSSCTQLGEITGCP